MRLTCVEFEAQQLELFVNFYFLDFKNEICVLSFIRTVVALRIGSECSGHG
jgi:hypothetical protein